MIREFEFYHGIVFTSLFHYTAECLRVGQFPSADNSSYVVNDSVGVYVKYSTKRMSPWHFSFEKRHNAEIVEMSRRFERVIVMLVCKDDGVAGVNYEEFGQIVDVTVKSMQWVSVVRRPREKYSVKGPLGSLSYKIGMTDYCEKVLGSKSCLASPTR